MGMFGNAVGLFVGVVITAFIFGSIFRKAGYSGWLAVLIFVPLVNVGILLWFATTTWPLEKAAGGQGVNDKGNLEYELKSALRRALALEKRRQWDHAVKEFTHVVQLAGDSPNGNLAQEHIQQIQTKRTTGNA